MLLKVCCVQTEAEARLAAGAGATHIGLVGAMPSGPGPIPDADIARIAGAAPEGVTSVLLTAEADADGIIEHVRRTGVGAVQLVRHVTPGVRRSVKEALPDLTLLQVVHVEDEASVAFAVEAAETGADLLLLDSGRPSAATPELGGTGRTHDWALSARIVEAVAVPVLLAGGLKPHNVADAVAAVGPAGVDVCSGVRNGAGRLDPQALTAFAGALGMEPQRVD